MHKKRIESCIKKMKEENLEGLLYATGANFQYLTNATDYHWQRVCENNIMGQFSAKTLPECVLYLNTKGEFTVVSIPSVAKHFNKEHLLVSYVDQMADTISTVINEKKIGIGYDCHEWIKETLKEVNETITTVDAELLLAEMRSIKDEEEIAQLRKMAKFTDDAVMHLVKNLKLGMTQLDAEQMLMQYAIDHNLDDLSFPHTAGFKTKGTFTKEENFLFPRDSVLKQNTGIAFDVGYLDKGYCSDWGRSVYIGEASEKVREGYKALQAGQVYMVSKIVPNKTNVNELFDLVKEEVARLGHQDVLLHQERGMLGHQIGIDCHEHPMLNRATDAILRPGMVFCSEPKMMFDGECYVRVEDMILVTETGAEFLTNFDRDLFEIKLNS